MNPDPRHVETVFQAAADLPAADRDAYLDEACAADATLRDRVRDLLDRFEDDDSMTVPDLPPAVPGGPFLTAAVTEGPGSIIGRYKILQVIGEGGFGVVYMAEQQEPVVRKVALKLIKLGMDTREVVARFEAERQALAMMDHPYIARVLDGGATRSGRPYFVMELVRGVSITEYCDREELSTDARLELFEQVCHAMQHAHQKGVIHRDLKPSNVLVTLHDGRPEPKIIDFGVAKAMHARLTEKTLFTRYEQFIGTPAYMSPEQAEMSALDVDTRTDIYSLGVLLYELLSGETPFESQSLEKVGLAGIQRMIVEHVPVRPSVRISSTGNAVAARHRQLDVAGLSRRLRGDLDWIVMKALEKERNRRYASAGDFAEDVRRHLRKEPVLAGPPGALYRAKKFLARNRTAVVSSMLIVLALVGGIIATSVAKVQSDANADRAEKQRDHAIQALDFLISTLALTDRDVALNPDVTVRTLLDHTGDQVEQAFSEQPWAEARVRATIGQAYVSLSEFELAEPHLRRAVDLVDEITEGDDSEAMFARIPGYDAGDFYDTLWTLTNVCFNLDRTDAFEFAQRSRHVGLGHIGRTHLEVARTLDAFLADVEANAWSLEPNALDGAALKFEAAAAQAEADLDPADDRWNIIADSFLVGAYTIWYTPHEPVAVPFLRTSLEIQRRVLPPEHPDITTTIGMLVGVLNGQGRGAEAEVLMREAVDALQRVHGEGSFRLALSRSLLGECLAQQERYAEAEPILLDAHAQIVEAVDASNWNAAQSLARLVNLYDRWGRPERATAYRDSIARTSAEAEYVSAWALTRSSFGPEHDAITTLVDAIDQGCGGISYQVTPGTRVAPAEVGGQVDALMAEIETLEARGPRGVLLARMFLGWANALEPSAHVELRYRLAEYCRATLERAGSPLPLERAEALALIASNDVDLDPGQRRALARDAWRLQRDAAGEGRWFTESTRVRIARVLIDQGLFDEAESILEAAHDVFVNQLGWDHVDTVVTRRVLHDLYVAWGRPDAARIYAVESEDAADPG